MWEVYKIETEERIFVCWGKNKATRYINSRIDPTIYNKRKIE